MEKEEKRISRILKGDKETIDAEEMLRAKCEKVFSRINPEKVYVIDIQTAYNDYKKLYEDMREAAEALHKEVVCFSEGTGILDMVNAGELRKACKNKGIRGNEIWLNIFKMCEVFLCFLNIFQIIYLFAFKGEYHLTVQSFLSVLLMLLVPAAIIPIMLLTKRRNREIIEMLDKLDEDKLIELYGSLWQSGSLLEDERIYFVENFSKLDKNCRGYIRAYLSNVRGRKQLWCVFDYLFENSKKISTVKDNVSYESFHLMPLKYTEKEAIYKEHNLQREIDREYLNCIGVDVLWGYRGIDISGGFRFHSLDYIREKIDKTRKELDTDGGLTKIFYCLVYMSSKYKYSFSIDQIVSLIRNEETVNKDLYYMISDAGNRIFDGSTKSKQEIQSFFRKIIELLNGYYFAEEKSEGGRKVKKYKFSYDILECFQEELSVFYPDEETVKRWILVKLVGNMDMFRMDRYFFDCSNLLVMSDFLEDGEFCILSSQLLRMMNGNNCWVYSGPILEKLRSIDEDDRNQYLQAEEVKRAAVNNLFYVSDGPSVERGIYFLTNPAESGVSLDDFEFDSLSPWLPEMEKQSAALAGYFRLLYITFGRVILELFPFGRGYQDIAAEPFAEQECLPDIIRELVIFSIACLNGRKKGKGLARCDKCVVEQLEKIATCEETKTFCEITKEMLVWAKSELYKEKDREYRNVYVGMLIETLNSNMLYFIYGLLNMALVRDRDIVYRNRNALLDFISQSVFYFTVVTHGEGITGYVNNLIQGSRSAELKLNMALRLLVQNSPCREILRRFILENMDRTEALIMDRLDVLDTESAMEDYLGSLFLYNENIGSKEFTERIFGQILKRISEMESFDTGRICKYLGVVLDKKCPDEEYMDIVDEINRMGASDFAIWVLYAYCEAKEEMLERLPQIDWNIFVECSSNIGTILMAKYLERHSYYDCSRDILGLYLYRMRIREFPAAIDIISYLQIIDQYARDNAGIKQNEIRTYNYLLSLLLFYIELERAEQKEMSESLQGKTLEFLIYILRNLRMSGMEFIIGNEIFSSWMESGEVSKRNPGIEQLIAEKFLYLEPVEETEEGKYLSKDYYVMVYYMCAFPDVYNQLIKKAESCGMEVIRQKHILYLIRLMLDREGNRFQGFHRESLEHVRSILEERYNIWY